MLSALSPLRMSTIRTKCVPKHSYIALYSTVMGLTRHNWQTSGPAPQSLVSKNTTTEYESRKPQSVVGLGHRTPQTSGSTSQPLVSEELEAGSESQMLQERDATTNSSQKFNEPREPTPNSVRKHAEAMKKAFPEGWQPPRKLSRDAMDGLRSLHSYDPETFSTPVLASKFRISPEAVRRILRSKWVPSAERRAEQAAKERKDREEWIQRRRVEENRKHSEILKTIRPSRVRGANKQDRLMFE